MALRPSDQLIDKQNISIHAIGVIDQLPLFFLQSYS
jgi:hypothetical protein